MSRICGAGFAFNIEVVHFCAAENVVNRYGRNSAKREPPCSQSYVSGYRHNVEVDFFAAVVPTLHFKIVASRCNGSSYLLAVFNRLFFNSAAAVYVKSHGINVGNSGNNDFNVFQSQRSGHFAFIGILRVVFRNFSCYFNKLRILVFNRELNFFVLGKNLVFRIQIFIDNGCRIFDNRLYYRIFRVFKRQHFG